MLSGGRNRCRPSRRYGRATAALLRGLVEGVRVTVVLLWVGIGEAEVKEGVGLHVGRALDVFQLFLIGAGFGVGGAEDGIGTS